VVELSQAEPNRWLRKAGTTAAAILVSEYLLLSFAVDTERIQQRISWLSGFEYLGPLGIAIGTAILVFTITRKASIIVPAPAKVATARRAPAYVVAHALLLVTFVLLTHALFGSRALILGAPQAWFVTWVLLGLATVTALALVVVQPQQLVSLVQQARVSILIGFLAGIVAWKAGQAAEGRLGGHILWGPLGDLTVRAVAQVLSWFFSDSISDPHRLLVGTSHFRVIVAPGCSGAEGIALIIVLQAFWLVALRRELRFPNAFLLLPIGVAIVWASNVIRIAALIAIGSRWSREVAMGGFHSKAGWVLFCGVALVWMLVARSIPFFTRELRSAEKEEVTWNPTAAYLAPLLLGIAVQLVAGLFSIPASFFYPIQGLAILAALWAYRQSYGLWRFSFSWAVLMIGAFAFALPLALERLLAHTTTSRTLDVGASWAAVPLMLGGLARSVVLVPVAEELAFRGYLLRRLISADFTDVSPAKLSLTSLLVSSLAFGVLQNNWLAGAIAGMLYAYAQYRRGRIEDAFLAHAVTSLLAVMYSWWFAPLRHA